MKGGKRAGAGRPKGAVTKLTGEIAARALAEGKAPLEYMLEVMRDAKADQGRRDDMAKAAAPYVHPRLAQVDQKIEGEQTLRVISGEPLTPQQWAALYGSAVTPAAIRALPAAGTADDD